MAKSLLSCMKVRINNMSKILKISSFIFFFSAIALVLYLSVTLDTKKGYDLSIIEIEGNRLTAKDQYYKFAKLDNKDEYETLTLAIIKSRIEKHPYVKSVLVKYDGDNKVLIRLVEKKIEAILFDGEAQFLLTDKFEVLPVLPFTKQMDYPVISNPVLDRKLSLHSFLNKNKDVVTGYKIIETIKLINPELYSLLSEVDLRDGRDILLSFSTINFPVVVGRKNEIRKVINFNTLWSYLKGNQISNMMDYVDLRYYNHMYLGISEFDSIGEG